MRFSNHALKRIQEGDERGARTVLSPGEVMNLLRSELVVDVDEFKVVYSERDKGCLCALVRDEVIVTVLPGRYVPYVYCMVAEQKVFADGIFVHQPLTYSKSLLEKQYSALLGFGPSRQKYQMVRQEVWPFCLLGYTCPGVNWFRCRAFVELLYKAVQEYAKRDDVILLRGWGWSTEFPTWLPARLLGKDDPFA